MARSTLAVILVAAGIGGFVCVPPAAGAGAKIRFYIDKNNNDQFDNGEQLPKDIGVIYKKVNSSSAVFTKTDADGYIAYSGANKGDKIYCKYVAFSYPAIKGERSYAGSMFDLVFDTLELQSDGSMKQRELTQAEANDINAGVNRRIRLAHPVWAWNLTVTLNFLPDQDYIDKLKSGFKTATNYMYDITDGHARLQNIHIRVDTTQSKNCWKQADIQIYKLGTNCANKPNTDEWPHMSGGVGVLNSSGSAWVHLPEKFKGENPDGKRYLRTIVHELGHYLFDFYDEYMDGAASSDNWSKYSKKHKDKVPDDYGFMDDQFNSSEMSSYNDYLSSYDGYDKTEMTRQIWEYDCRTGGGHEPCWQHFWERFDNSSGTQTLWQSGGSAYGGIKVVVNKPPWGKFTGRDFWGNETRVGSDRGGPNDFFPMAIGDYPDVWPAANFKVEYVAAAAQQPAPQATQSRAAPAGAGPRVLMDAHVGGTPGDATVTLRLMSSVPLVSPPTVSVRPDHGSPVPVPMSPIGPKMYEGSVNVGDAHEGIVDVTAVGSMGATVIATAFQIVRLPAGQAASIYGSSGWFDANLPADALAQETLAISIGSGGSPIMPSDTSLRLVGDPTSFHLQDGVSVGSVYTTNTRLDPDVLRGMDSTTLSFRRFEAASGEWVPVTGFGFTPGREVVSAANVGEGIYATFARESADNTPPGPVLGLTASTGSSGKGVRLSWIAPGDDGFAGQAVRYHVWSSTDPINPGDLSGCMPLPILDQPKQPGEVEDHAFEMPDPHKLYYFAVQAQDEAGNIGPLSNVASAVSYAQDTDGDGLSDDWETTYGFDPQTPGEELLDPDGDGLTNLQEYNLGTNPTDPDTDSDGLSDGLEVAAGTSPTSGSDPVVGSPAAIKLQPDGVRVGCGGLVTTAAFPDGIAYAQQPDRSSGIRFESASVPVSRLVEVIGTLATTQDGERYLAGAFYADMGPASADPIGLTNRALGGGDWFYDPEAGTGQGGVKDGFGLNNIGLFVEIWGAVTYSTLDVLYLDDGTALDDGSGQRGVRVLYPGVVLPIGTPVTVTGISSCFMSGNELCRQVLSY